MSVDTAAALAVAKGQGPEQQEGLSRSPEVQERQAGLLTRAPCLKKSCSAEVRSGVLCIRNGPFELRISLPEAPDPEAVRVLNERPSHPEPLVKAMSRMLQCGPEEALEAIDALTRAGVIVEHPDARPASYSGEYIGHRLIDTFRLKTHQVWDRNPLFPALREGRNRSLALGFLLETYFLIRAANWTAPAVLGHSMTELQRMHLNQFFLEERGHSDRLAEAFAEVGMDPYQLRRAQCLPENTQYQQYFFTCGHRSAAHFASAIVIPEVREIPPGANVAGTAPASSTSLIKQTEGIPARLVEAFEGHEHLDEDAEHADLPVTLLAEEGWLSPQRVDDLFATLDFGIYSKDLFLRGVLRHYQSWDSKLLFPPFGDY